MTEPTRRAWLIVAREWKKMAEREETLADDRIGAVLPPPTAEPG